MAEYIERGVVMKVLNHELVDADTGTPMDFYNIAIKTVRRMIEGIPAADVQPVRHAAWDYAMPVDGPERNRYRCSRCSGFALLDYWGNDVRSRYCPECGAIMDDEGKKYWVHYDGELTPAED